MRWVVTCGCLLSIGAAAVLHSPHKEKQMATDVTIYLHDPIISTGGTVFIIPREVDASSARDADSKLTVDVGEPVSIVRFDYPRGDRWVLRFDSRSPLPPGRGGHAGTAAVGIGSGSYRDSDTDQMIEVKQFETFHVFGPQVSESDSRLQEDKLFTYLRRGTHRVDFTGAQVLTPLEAGK